MMIMSLEISLQILCTIYEDLMKNLCRIHADSENYQILYRFCAKHYVGIYTCHFM